MKKHTSPATYERNMSTFVIVDKTSQVITDIKDRLTAIHITSVLNTPHRLIRLCYVSKAAAYEGNNNFTVYDDQIFIHDLLIEYPL